MSTFSSFFHSLFLPDGLRERNREPEFMDDPAFSGDVLSESFQFIKYVNLLGGGQRAIVNGLRRALLGRSPMGPLRVLDVGCGLGDMGPAILRWGSRNGLQVKYTGLEQNPQILEYAKAQRRNQGISLIQGDLFDEALPVSDIVLASMVLHHLDDTHIVKAIQHLSRKARIALIINDLERSPASYGAAWLLTRLLTHWPSRSDALLSVRKGFTEPELRGLLSRTGVDFSLRPALGWRLLAVVEGTSARL